MSEVKFISDLHLGHKTILEFGNNKTLRGGTNADEHDEWIIDQINSNVNKNDLLIVCGDVCMDINKIHLLEKVRCQMHMVMGNHDEFNYWV